MEDTKWSLSNKLYFHCPTACEDMSGINKASDEDIIELLILFYAKLSLCCYSDENGENTIF
jgi:hypothetical protein